MLSAPAVDPEEQQGSVFHQMQVLQKQGAAWCLVCFSCWGLRGLPAPLTQGCLLAAGHVCAFSAWRGALV